MSDSQLERAQDVRLSRRRHQWRLGALARAEEKIQFIQARHEEMAAFMASAYAKFSGELGVCMGATHLLAQHG